MSTKRTSRLGLFRSISLRGDRMTKFRGQVCSIAPQLAGLAMAAIATPALFGPDLVQAADECGAESAGADVIVCAPGTYATGITYEDSDGLTLDLNDGAIIVGEHGVGVRSDNTTTDAITVNGTAFGTITTTNSGADGLGAWHLGLGDATATLTIGDISTEGTGAYGLISYIGNSSSTAASNAVMGGGSITTTGNVAYGIYAENHGNGLAAVTLTGGVVSTSDGYAHGVQAANVGLGLATATMSGGDISTSGNNAFGLWSGIFNVASSAAASLTMSGGTVTTSGTEALGLMSFNNGLGEATATLAGGDVSTAGNSSYGVHAWNLGQGDATALLTGGDVSTEGEHAHGLYARNEGTGDAIATVTGGSVTVTGLLSHGVYAHTLGTGTAAITMTDGEVSTAGASTAGLFARAADNGTGNAVIEISGGSVTTLASDSSGAYAFVSDPDGMGDAIITMTGGSVASHDIESYGLRTYNNGLGDAVVTLDNGDISTTGSGGYGVYAQSSTDNPDKAARAVMNGGTVDTTGADAYGVHAGQFGKGSTNALMTGGDVTTRAVNAIGLSAIGFNTLSEGANSAEMRGGTITTRGNNAYGILARSRGFGAASATLTDGDVTTAGSSSNGVFSLVEKTDSAATSTAAMTGGTVGTTGNNASGLLARTRGQGDAIATLSGGSVTTNGFNSYGAHAHVSAGGSSGNALVNVEGGSITILSESAGGAVARQQGQGSATVNVSGGSLITSGDDSYAAYAIITNGSSTNEASANMTGGSITTTGWYSQGLYALTLGRGNVQATLDDGAISTSGGYSSGVQAHISNATSTATATATMNGGSVTTSGIFSHGLVLDNVSLGDSVATMTGGAVTTTGASSAGLYVLGYPADSPGNVTAIVTGGTITTQGMESHGVATIANGTGKAVISMTDGTVSASGTNADAIRAMSAGGSFDIDVNGGSATGGSGQGAGIRTAATAGGTIDIGAGATVDGSASGISIRDGDADQDGIDEVGGNAVVTVDGTVTGDAILGLGDDVFNLRFGSMTGDIHGDDILASGVDGNDTFNWTGGALNSGFYGGNGSDTALIDAGAIYDGTEVLDGGDDATVGDGWIDVLTYQGISATSDSGIVRNWEQINLASTNLTLTGGTWTAGGLAIDGASSLLLPGGGAGRFDILGNVANAGTLSTMDGAAGDVVTVGGDYTGSGVLLFDVDLATTQADTMTVSGDVTGGPTSIGVNDVSSGGAIGNAALLITVDGATDEDDFALAGGPVMSGAHLYDLQLSGNTWLLSAVAFAPATPVYEVYGQNLMALNMLETLQQRVGNRFWNLGGYAAGGLDNHASAEQGQAIWFRVDGAYDQFGAAGSTSGASHDTSAMRLRLGLEAPVTYTENGLLVAGINGFAGEANTNVRSPVGNGSIETRGYGVAATVTWYDASGFYADAQAQTTWFTSTLNSASSVDALVTDNQGSGYAFSAEIGQRFAFDRGWSVTPQAQLTYSSVSFDAFTDSNGNMVELLDADSLRGRLGLAVEHEWHWKADNGTTSRSHLYAIANIVNEFDNGTTVSVAGTKLDNHSEELAGELGIGGSLNTIDDKASLYGEMLFASDLADPSDYNSFSGKIGFRLRF